MEARGLTLLELLVALGITATVAATALLSVHTWFPDLRLRAATRQIIQDLRLTRARAVGERVNRRLVFAPGTDTYQAQKKPASTYEDDGPAVALPPSIDLIDCTATGKAVGFTSRGAASTFGTITLRATSGREQQVIVDIAGRIRVQ